MTFFAGCKFRSSLLTPELQTESTSVEYNFHVNESYLKTLLFKNIVIVRKEYFKKSLTSRVSEGTKESFSVLEIFATILPSTSSEITITSRLAF